MDRRRKVNLICAIMNLISAILFIIGVIILLVCKGFNNFTDITIIALGSMFGSIAFMYFKMSKKEKDENKKE